jgi:hypothetical protein
MPATAHPENPQLSVDASTIANLPVTPMNSSSSSESQADQCTPNVSLAAGDPVVVPSNTLLSGSTKTSEVQIDGPATEMQNAPTSMATYPTSIFPTHPSPTTSHPPLNKNPNVADNSLLDQTGQARDDPMIDVDNSTMSSDISFPDWVKLMGKYLQDVSIGNTWMVLLSKWLNLEVNLNADRVSPFVDR